ncbi:type VI secretion system domain-containing protein, partial [Acidisphaera rubrifaciens]|uniref:type VI secretion system domain-containing protein n=1 Tax=Acidisphaera rubrifaciens TaxID=50715 RepID=UPI0006620424
TAAAGSGREWFCWRLALASLCLETGAAPLALALAQELDDIARARRLADWEPALAAQAGLLLHRCLGSPDAQTLFTEDARGRALAAAFMTLARSDPAAAWRLGSKPVG